MASDRSLYGMSYGPGVAEKNWQVLYVVEWLFFFWSTATLNSVINSVNVAKSLLGFRSFKYHLVNGVNSSSH